MDGEVGGLVDKIVSMYFPLFCTFQYEITR